MNLQAHRMFLNKELIDELQLPKGKVIVLKASQKNKTKQLSKALSSATNSKAENSDGELSEEDEEELTFLTKRVQRLLRKRKWP